MERGIHKAVRFSWRLIAEILPRVAVGKRDGRGARGVPTHLGGGDARAVTALMEAIAAIVIVLCVQLWSAKGDGGPHHSRPGLFFSHCQKR